MKNLKKLTTICCACLCLHLTGGALSAAPAQDNATGEAAVRAVNSFAVEMYLKLSAQEGNLCFSPYSISTAFAMLYAGARGETAAELERAFFYGDKIHDSNATLRYEILGAPDDAGRIFIANSIWPQQGYILRKAFLSLLERAYASEVHPQDYIKNAPQSRVAINRWVEEQTAARIKDLLPPDGVDESTRLVLVNAIYFKAPWMNEFTKHATAPAPFYAPSGVYEVATMQKSDTTSYYENEDLQAVKLLYRKGAFSMTIILPKVSGQLSEIEKRMNADYLKGLGANLQKRLVEVYLPKFKVESSFSLNQAIKALGVEKAFQPGEADFSGINGERDLFVSAAVHKAFIEVDEDGTEAAAATAIGMSMMSAPMPLEPIVFRADHPFIFVIQDEISGALLFMGRVTQP